ncbi:MAG: cytochrome c [Alphaproteobacteria bacterium]|nr:cytochrome c [Rhodospirillales bacterium]MCW9045618.1 cytochrome c [Alphaproteobacteria bacterium]
MNGKILIPGLIAVGLVVAILLVLSQALNQQNRGIDATNQEMVNLGKHIYQANCATECHGKDLKGQPNWREPLPDGGLPAPPHDESGHTWHHPDSFLFDYTKKGGEALAPKGFQSHMPGFGEILSDKEIWAVLSYIKSQWPVKIQYQQENRNPQ